MTQIFILAMLVVIFALAATGAPVARATHHGDLDLLGRRSLLASDGCGKTCSGCPNSVSCGNQQGCFWSGNNCKAASSLAPMLSPSPLPATLSSRPSPHPSDDTGDCQPVSGLTTGFESPDWSPFVLKQTSPGQGYLVANARSSNAASGQYGATVTIQQPGTALWHVQLSSAPAELSSSSLYTLTFTTKSSVATYLQVALVQDGTWEVFYVTQPKTVANFSTFTVYNLAPTRTASYLLNFDLGLAAAGTTYAFDDIMVCRQKEATPDSMPAATTDTLGTLRTDTSTDFEAGAPALFKVQVNPPADAASVLDSQAQGAVSAGAYGAAVTVNTPGSAPWHIQLAGPVVLLSANKTYTVQLAARQTGSRGVDPVVNVNWVLINVYIPTSVATIVPTSDYKTYTLSGISLPQDGYYYLTADMGTVAASTTLFFDSIKVFEAGARP